MPSQNYVSETVQTGSLCRVIDHDWPTTIDGEQHRMRLQLGTLVMVLKHREFFCDVIIPGVPGKWLVLSRCLEAIGV